MKKQILILLIINIANCANAQFVKGNIIINSCVGYNQYKRNSIEFNANQTKNSNITQTTKKLNLSLNVGKCLKSNFVLGLHFSLFQNKAIQKSEFGFIKEYKTKADNYRIGLFTQKYFPIKEKYNFYMGLNASVGHIEYKYTDRDTIVNDPFYFGGFSSNILLNAGLSYRLSKKILLNIGVGDIGWSYNVFLLPQNSGRISQTKTSEFNLGLSELSFNVGLTYILSKKSK